MAARCHHGPVTVLDEARGDADLRRRVASVFAAAREEMICAAPDLNTWAVLYHSTAAAPALSTRSDLRVRKLYGPAVVLDPAMAGHVDQLAAYGAEIRVTTAPLQEVILLDRQVAVMAGDSAERPRRYRIVTAPEVVSNVAALLDAAWRSAVDRTVYAASLADLRTLAPALLDALASGAKDEAAARALGMSLRTYRRRVAELMTAVGATSRFQAGLRARDLGLV